MATDRIKHDLRDALERTRVDLDRVELFAAALAMFSRPVLDYEPQFHHVNPATLTKHELGKPAARKRR